MLAFHPDGTLAYVSCLAPEETHTFSLFDEYVIDEGRVDSSLAAFYCYASWFYRRLGEAKTPIFSLYTTVVLFDEQGRRLGKRPASRLDSITVNMGFPDQCNPLVIPQRPLKIAYARLMDYQDLSEELMHLIVRACKAGGRYYEA